MSKVTVLPDGSAFGVMSFPLPKDHWLYEEHFNVPPMPMRIGVGEERTKFAEMIRAAAKYAIRAATMNGKEPDFDPDAMIQCFVVGLLGYWTKDGTTDDKWEMPDPIPPEFK